VAKSTHSSGTVKQEVPLPAGTPAPDFSLATTPDQKVSLSDFRGQPVILVFYPADWSPAWPPTSWYWTATRSLTVTSLRRGCCKRGATANACSALRKR